MIGKRGVIQALPDGPEDPKMQTMLSVAFGAVSSVLLYSFNYILLILVMLIINGKSHRIM